jgi:copper(I)-binding protein
MSIRRHPFGRAAVGLAAVVLAATGLVACGDDSEDTASEDTTTTTEAATAAVEVADVWARPVADLAAQDTSAIYMVITGGDEDDALVGASVPADVAATVELHETAAAEDTTTTAMGGGAMDETTTTAMGGGDMGGGDMGGGMMTMRQVPSIAVPAGETVELKPGGFHIMLLDVQRVIEPGETIEVTLTFESGEEIVTTAEVREP